MEVDEVCYITTTVKQLDFKIMATLVVDNGAGSIKIGYNKDNEPK